MPDKITNCSPEGNNHHLQRNRIYESTSRKTFKMLSRSTTALSTAVGSTYVMASAGAGPSSQYSNEESESNQTTVLCCRPSTEPPKVARPGGRYPYLEIIEPPTDSVRFRYECDKNAAGSIHGVYSSKHRHSYPKVRLYYCNNDVEIRASLVTKDQPYRAHPNGLIGQHCTDYIMRTFIRDREDPTDIEFKNLGILRVSPKQNYDIVKALTIRQKLGVDPFGEGFEINNSKKTMIRYNINAVRLCFQLFVRGPSGEIQEAHAPVVSNVIYDSKTKSDLIIERTLRQEGSAKGGTEFWINSYKVSKDVKVLFFEEKNGVVEWYTLAEILVILRKITIICKIPPYKNTKIKKAVKVSFCLWRSSDGFLGKPETYTYLPDADERSVENNLKKELVPIQNLPQSSPDESESLMEEGDDWSFLKITGEEVLSGQTRGSPAWPETSHSSRDLSDSCSDASVMNIDMVQEGVGSHDINPAPSVSHFYDPDASEASYTSPGVSGDECLNQIASESNYMDTGASGVHFTILVPSGSHNTEPCSSGSSCINLDTNNIEYFPESASPSDSFTPENVWDYSTEQIQTQQSTVDHSQHVEMSHYMQQGYSYINTSTSPDLQQNNSIQHQTLPGVEYILPNGQFLLQNYYTFKD